MTQLYQNPERSEELKKKKILSSSSSPPWGRGLRQGGREGGGGRAAEAAPFMPAGTEAPRGAQALCRPLIGPRGRRLSQSAVWEAGPFMKAAAERKLGGRVRRVISGPRGPCSGHRSSVLALPLPAPAGLWQARPGLGAEEQVGLSGSASRAEPGSQTLPPSVNCGHEVVFLPLLIEIICFQFPDKFIEFPLRLGPLGCRVWICSCGPDPHNFVFLELPGLEVPEPD